ncbi:hypothetical protein Syun_028774 [Stephania yunnanensis]|uniref:Protein argonaute N-terminal domain-containing protein n=1 Tax=Stephania yunnanensis TaxID=152371 RepID=A0AAP0E465_9MAGN
MEAAVVVVVVVVVEAVVPMAVAAITHLMEAAVVVMEAVAATITPLMEAGGRGRDNYSSYGGRGGRDNYSYGGCGGGGGRGYGGDGGGCGRGRGGSWRSDLHQASFSSDVERKLEQLSLKPEEQLIRFSSRPPPDIIGEKFLVKTNHFQVEIDSSLKEFFHYNVSIKPEVLFSKDYRVIMEELCNLYLETDMNGEPLAYDGRKSFYTRNRLPFVCKEFGFSVRNKQYVVAISLVAVIELGDYRLLYDEDSGRACFHLPSKKILKHEWSARWQSFVPDLVSAAKTSETIYENCMAISKVTSISISLSSDEWVKSLFPEQVLSISDIYLPENPRPRKDWNAAELRRSFYCALVRFLIDQMAKDARRANHTTIHGDRRLIVNIYNSNKLSKCLLRSVRMTTLCHSLRYFDSQESFIGEIGEEGRIDGDVGGIVAAMGYAQFACDSRKHAGAERRWEM